MLHRSAPPILGLSRGELLNKRCGTPMATRLRQPSSSESRGCSYMVGSGNLDSRIRNPRWSARRDSYPSDDEYWQGPSTPAATFQSAREYRLPQRWTLTQLRNLQQVRQFGGSLAREGTA